MEEPIPMSTPPLPAAHAPSARRHDFNGRVLATLLSSAVLLVLTACATPGALPPQDVATVQDAALPSSDVALAPPAADSEAVAAAAAASAAIADGSAARLDLPESAAAADQEDTPVVLNPPVEGDDSDLWQRLRAGVAMPDLDNALVRKWEDYYARRPDYVQRMTERGGRYLFHILEEVEKRGMPADLALLPFIESAFNPQAVSNARASGMWQFMPATGRDFELRQNLFRDDRRDVLASTQAALDYLQMLHKQFGDWHLALAAYNWGQGNVQRAVRRNAAAGQPTDYESLRMPAETRNYVPKLQAVKNIMLRPDDFGLELPPLKNHPFFLSLPIVRDIDVALAARLAGVELEEFQTLNPQLNKPVILAAGTPQVLLPYDNAHQFAQALAQHRGPMASWTAWVAPRTLTAAAAAKMVGLSEARLREINRIPPRMKVRVGSTLLVPRAAHTTQDVDEHIANTAMLALAPESRGRRVVLRVGKRGDSVAAIAKRHRVAVADVAAWNQVSTSARFKSGARVVVYKPPVRQAAAKRRVARPVAARATAPQAAAKKVAKSAPRTQARPTAASKLRVAQGQTPAAR
jgi:membrane-bound lytic murein transglycosylase D